MTEISFPINHDIADETLIERLRWGNWYYEDPFDGVAYADDAPLDAAVRIEQLEAALRGISDFGKRHTGHGYSCHLLARAALGEKQ